MTKLVPSPDWFIGLDGLQLCQEGIFLESFSTEVTIFTTSAAYNLSLQAFPMDAGTDNGFTFTSPNWETEPRAEVSSGGWLMYMTSTRCSPSPTPSPPILLDPSTTLIYQGCLCWQNTHSKR